MPSTAAEWFEEGMAAMGMSRTADYGSEFAADLERAIAAFEQALALEPTHLRALTERGLAHALLGQHEAALDSFVAAIDQAPDDAELRLAVAQSLVKVGQLEAALGAFEKAVRLRPGDQVINFGRADVLMALRRDDQAVPAWDEVLRAPDNRTISVGGRTARVITDDFRRLHAQLSRALALGRLGRPDAGEAFRAVFDAHPLKLTTLGASGILQEALRTLEVARAAYRAHLDARAGDPFTWRRAGQVWQAAGRAQDAVHAYELLLSQAPDAQAWFGKAEAHAQAGELEKAISSYERALELWPGFLGAAARLRVVREQAQRQLALSPTLSPSGRGS